MSFKLGKGCKECKKENKEYYSSNKSKCKDCLILIRKKKFHSNKAEELIKMKSYAEKNKEKLLRYSKDRWKKADKDIEKARNRKWREENIEHKKDYAYRYHQENKERDQSIRAFHLSKRRAIKLKAIPSWADLNKVKLIYKKAKELEKETGIKYHVDHIIPLQGKNVCGFHAEINLQVITAKENLKKGNRI